ncbi:unnamed protein product [Moneuplotes crassus]|uniref:Uncharacterized protein n=1 Tax=Euplotes crassus TaxID=5936 RepID=A0AAD1XX36_EUPCR|nr:unnamed protein product [Moneuplotes crassus]
MLQRRIQLLKLKSIIYPWLWKKPICRYPSKLKLLSFLILKTREDHPPNTIPPELPSSIPPLQMPSPPLLPTNTIEERLEANEQRLEKMSQESWMIKEEVGKIKRERGTDKEKLSEQEIKRKANLMVQNAERERDHLARLLEMVEFKHNKYDGESSQQESGDSWEDSRSSHTSNLSSDGEFKIKLKDTGRKKDVPRVVEVIKDNFFSIMEEYENEKNYSQAELIQVRNDIKKMYSKVINYAVDGCEMVKLIFQISGVLSFIDCFEVSGELEMVKNILKDKESTHRAKLRAMQEDIIRAKEEVNELNSHYLRKFNTFQENKTRKIEEFIKEKKAKKLTDEYLQSADMQYDPKITNTTSKERMRHLASMSFDSFENSNNTSFVNEIINKSSHIPNNLEKSLSAISNTFPKPHLSSQNPHPKLSTLHPHPTVKKLNKKNFLNPI